MKTMKRCIVPSILLMLSLEAVLLVAAGRPSTATGADDVGTILLPSEGKGVVAAAKKGEEEERPWKCCDFALCTRSFPPLCRCMDKVEQCAATCESCEPATSDSSHRVCNDWYHGFPGPMCTEAVATAKKKKAEEEERPWKCAATWLCAPGRSRRCAAAWTRSSSVPQIARAASRPRRTHPAASATTGTMVSRGPSAPPAVTSMRVDHLINAVQPELQ
uniref:Bowman-Birk serine protease inhibitors family domain-containing protein n=1 Tax=Aegilops tauschii subsp. strangulata TaxID=200361 RepID=A0A453DSU0_AEGTS